MPSAYTDHASADSGKDGRVPVFSSYPLIHGQLADFTEDEFPTVASAWAEQALLLEATGTHFGFVHAGPAVLRCPCGAFSLGTGMYFAVPGAMSVTSGTGILISRLDYRGFFHVGGPVEARGRLRYIDGCTDSLLIPPVLQGDACLNLLHLPPGTQQTRHTHPSLRVGLIISGRGHCRTPEQCIPLTPGRAFVIRAGGLHSFHTEDEELLVLAYHPDSDFGPTHENHPMINRTSVPQTKVLACHPMTP
jgi:quercetin dioxygenase-like cupin family protein